MGYGVLSSTGVHKNCVRGTWGDTYAYFKLTVTDGPLFGRVACIRRSLFFDLVSYCLVQLIYGLCFSFCFMYLDQR